MLLFSEQRAHAGVGKEQLLTSAVNDRARAVKFELIPGLIFLGLALTLAGMAFFKKSLPFHLRQLFLDMSAALFVAAAGFLSAFLTDIARERGPFVPRKFSRKGAKSLPPAMDFVRRTGDRAYIRIANIDWRGDWLPLLTAMVLSASAVALAIQSWRILEPVPSLLASQWTGGILLVLCFPALVMERRFAGLSGRSLPNAAALDRLLRLLLLNLLAFALTYLLRWLSLPQAVIVERAALLFTALVAAEIALRCASYYFMPLPPLESRRSHADSLVAGLIRLQPPSLSGMSASISRQFGIDLGRSWALGFLRRAAIPALLGLAACGWLLTGVTALDISQRAVYEAFGRPQAVFHSGLHVYLPWPLGQLRPVEYGVVREIPIVFAAEDGTAPEKETPVTDSAESIEGPPAASADRLWDATHPSEASYLVASNRNGRENFEVVNIDLRVLYRIALTDRAAYNAIYSIEAPDALIRAAAGRMLARYFARYTIPDVLGQNRERFIRAFQKELQGRLNSLSSGVDILGVVIEAIHPPADAAAAYQDVQAAGIRSVTQVSEAKGEATATMQQAQSNATSLRDDAMAAAAELVDQAKVDTALFNGDVLASRQSGAAFLFERRLSTISNAIPDGSPLTISDHRIGPAQMPLLDLRPASKAPASLPDAD
jgi:regulator of protease activity HflC (stomatin/prohibitin superfamily)